VEPRPKLRPKPHLPLGISLRGVGAWLGRGLRTGPGVPPQTRSGRTVWLSTEGTPVRWYRQPPPSPPPRFEPYLDNGATPPDVTPSWLTHSRWRVIVDRVTSSPDHLPSTRAITGSVNPEPHQRRIRSRRHSIRSSPSHHHSIRSS
jgi:hypothetical protein